MLFRRVSARLVTLVLATLLLAVVSGCAFLPARGPIAFTRSGGFIGYADELVIAADGSAVLTDRGVQTTFTVPPDTLDAIEAAFALSGFRSLPDSTIPPGSADMIEYTFTWRGHTLRVAEAIPEPLTPAAALLMDLVEAHRAR